MAERIGDASLRALPPLVVEASSLPGGGVGFVDGGSLLLGLTLGSIGVLFGAAAVLGGFFQNIRDKEGVDGTRVWSFGGFVMPSFFFIGAQDIFNNVREEAAESELRFRETGRFADLYAAIERSQEQAFLRSLDALRDRFPKSGLREIVFAFVRKGARSRSRVAATLYNFALRLRREAERDGSVGVDILEDLWALDEDRCSVSGRLVGEGLRQPWAEPGADVLIDKQAAAIRSTVAGVAGRPLFARVAPEILARSTSLALIRLFDVFQPDGAVVGECPPKPGKDGALSSGSGGGIGGYSGEEKAAIDDFLTAAVRMPVMRRTCRYVAFLSKGTTLTEESWKKLLWKLWFSRQGGRPSVFEHIFLGNLSEDSSGQPVAGGLHSWLKFYLEEARGTATYLGYVYDTDPEDALRDHRFISGKFLWNFEGRQLLKDQGGFFVGTSPEWQLACGTAAFFETLDPERARRLGWAPWPGVRNGVGYTKDVVLGRFRYRYYVCASDAPSSPGEEWPQLYTSFASFLGPAAQGNLSEREERQRLRSPSSLAAKLPGWLVSEGLAAREISELCGACVDFCSARGCRSIDEALQELKQKVFSFSLEAAVDAARREPSGKLAELLGDSGEAASLLLSLEAGSSLEVPASAAIPGLLAELKRRGRRGPKLHQPLRLLLTGRPEGAAVADLFRLLELAEQDGGDEVGVKLADRLALVRKLFPQPSEPYPHSAGLPSPEAPTPQTKAPAGADRPSQGLLDLVEVSPAEALERETVDVL